MKKLLPRKSVAVRTLEKICGGPLTFGGAPNAARRCQDLSQAALAEQLGVSKSHLCDVEKGRKTVSPERAVAWAHVLGYPESLFAQLAVQDALDAAGLKYRVYIEAA
jgi:transcriptional regulator with XRE-family HTH domain